MDRYKPRRVSDETPTKDLDGERDRVGRRQGLEGDQERCGGEGGVRIGFRHKE